MREDVGDGFPVFTGGFFAAGEVDDHAAFALHADSAGEHGARGDAHAVGAHGLGDAGHVALAYVDGGFGGDVARGKTAAAAGQNEVGMQVFDG